MSNFTPPHGFQVAIPKQTECAEQSRQTTTRPVDAISTTRTTGERPGSTSSAKQSDIIIVGYVYRSQKNGQVYSPGGISCALMVGCHSGVEPKVQIINETS